MRWSALLALPAFLAELVYATAPPSTGEYSEHLHLKPLQGGYLYAGFNFTATTPQSAYDGQHFRFFPRSLGQILQHTHTAELHLRFALGRWDEESWGSRPRHGRREGGTGVELWAWVEDGGKEGGASGSVEERWSGLVNSLSGLFCASLNFIDGTKTTRPVLSFDPEGTHERRAGKAGRLQLLHGTLPHEVVCTENLTPFLKLLPCKGKAGISSLLDGHKVFDANWQTMSIDVRPVCSHGKECEIEIQQTVDIVLDIERSMRPRSDPIPRPLPVEQILCDETKSYNSHDTCYPKRGEGEMAWSLSRIFGQGIKGSCSLDDGDTPHDVSLEVHYERTVDVVTDGMFAESKTPSSLVRTYGLPEGHDFDLSLPKQSAPMGEDTPSKEATPLRASRQMTGYGQERGGMHASLHNPRPYAQRVVYLESLPWFLRPYMHTLRIRVNGRDAKLEKMFYTPALDRQRGTQLELLLEIPAESTMELAYDFEKAILRYTEYPPDANRGFDVAPAVIRVLPRGDSDESDAQGSYLRTTSLLLPLPTPDFSMPYNVIILTSTVIALGFGSIFNLLIRRFVLADEVPASPLAIRVKAVLQAVTGKLKRAKVEIANPSKGHSESPGDGHLNGNAGKDTEKDR